MDTHLNRSAFIFFLYVNNDMVGWLGMFSAELKSPAGRSLRDLPRFLMKQHVSPELRRDFWEEIPVPKPKEEGFSMMKSRE